MDAQLLQDMTALASKHADNADWQDLEKARLGVEEAFSALGRALDRAQARVAVLERALEQAVELIKSWHNMPGKGTTLTDEQVEQMWQVYYNHSPEMKPIREAQAALGEVKQ